MKKASGAEPVKVEKVQFGAGRMTLVVELAEGFEFTTPELIAHLCERYPELPHHACVNEAGPTFAAVMNHTSTAHLLEHLIITEQTRQTPPPTNSANPVTAAVSPNPDFVASTHPAIAPDPAASSVQESLTPVHSAADSGPAAPTPPSAPATSAGSAATAGPTASAALAATAPSASASTGRSAVFCGATTWISREQRRARIEVSFADDLIALKALHNALDALVKASR